MEVVADLAAVVGVALEELAGVPVLDQPLGQGQAAEATAGDENVQRLSLVVTGSPYPRPGEDQVTRPDQPVEE